MWWLMLSWVGDVASGNVEGLLFLAINASREFMITVEWVGGGGCGAGSVRRFVVYVRDSVLVCGCS